MNQSDKVERRIVITVVATSYQAVLLKVIFEIFLSRLELPDTYVRRLRSTDLKKTRYSVELEEQSNATSPSSL